MKFRKIFCVIAVLTCCAFFHGSTQAMIKAQEFRLENGLRVIFLEQHSLPIVRINLGLRGGNFWEQSEKAGVAFITFRLLDQGTKKRSALDIAKALDFVGASMSASAGKDFSTVTLSTLSKDLDLGLNILADSVLHPSFPEKEIQRIKKEVLSAIKMKKEDPSAVASEHFQKIIYGSTYYGRPLEGYEETVKKITREDIEVYYQKAFHPQLATLVVVGDITREKLMEKIPRMFGNWEKSDITMPEFSKIGKDYVPQSKKIKKDLTQTTIFLGHTGIKRENPDYYATYVMNYIMGGGGFSSRMMKEIRNNQGLVYSVYSYFNAMSYGGAFYTFAQTKNKTAEKAIKLIKEEMEQIKDKPVEVSELKDAKSYIAGSFPLKLNTTKKIASYLAYIAQYNLGLDYFETFPQKIKKVTLEDIQRVARKYLHQDNISIVQVGG